jgi:anaerobic selenocysteine-containing dehydrogenase/TorA maturation chaperone TorD
MSGQMAKLHQDRAQIYYFLSVLLRDEISPNLFDKLKGSGFLSTLKSAAANCPLPAWAEAFGKLAGYLEKAGAADGQELRYEYADIFLNAGPNPAFPYASFFVQRIPFLMGAVAEVRKYYRQGEVHKSPDYRDLDDHLAVELEFMGYLADAAAAGDADQEKLQFEFLREHLVSWGAEFSAVLDNSAQSAFYRALADIVLQFLSQDRALAMALQAGQEPPAVQTQAFAAMAQAVAPLGLGKELFCLAKGAVPEGPATEVLTHCYHCNAQCGMTVKVKDGIITGIGGLEGDIRSLGRLCPKGASAQYITYSAYRLKAPLIREDGRFRKATWEEALNRVGDALNAIDSSKWVFLRGNDFNNWLTEGIFKAYGAHMVTHRTMCDNPMRMANEHNLNDKRPWIDYREADYILNFGHNEFACSQSQRKLKYLKDALARGAKMVVVDPRRCETAAAATEWIPIKSGTDGAMAMAICYVLVKNNLYNQDFVDNWTYGFEDFRRRLFGEEDGTPRTPAWAEKICEVPAATIERVALELAQADHPTVVSWTGVAQAPNAFHGSMAVWAINGLLGTYDAPGGPSLPFKRKPKSAWGPGQEKPPEKKTEKLHKMKMWAGYVNAYFPRDVEEGKIQAMLNYWGCPILSWTNCRATEAAIKKLKFVASIEAFMCNTAVYSHVVLPSVSTKEMSRVYAEWGFDAAICFTQKSIAPLYDSRPDFYIFTEIGKRLGLGQYLPWQSDEEAMANQLAGTPWSLEELKAKGFILTDTAAYYKYQKWGGLNQPEGYGASGKTKTGKYNFKNPVAEEKGVDALPDYKDPYADWPDLKPDADYPLLGGNFRFADHEHSSTQNNYFLMSQVGKNPVWINYLDAKARGIKNGDRVVVKSPWGQITTEAHVTWNIRQGIFGIGGGFGHIRGLEADPKYPQMGGTMGVGALLPPNVSDAYAGTVPLKMVKVQIAKAA